MKNYLKLIREYFTNKQADVSNKEQEEDISILNDIADVLGIDFVLYEMRQLESHGGWGGANKFALNDTNRIFLYPPNDGFPTCPFEFHKDKDFVMDNQNAYIEIINIDEVILHLVKIISKGLDDNIVLDPYYFMLQLTDEVKENYEGRARLLITDKAIRNQKLNEYNFNEAAKYFINHFLDHFLGWNFGVSINRNQELKSEVNALNDKVIKMGIREYAGTGFEVWCSNSVKHYDFPETDELREAWLKKKRKGK